MILAEKITQLRKKNGWSQEELAEQLNVSRQSVSKWESAQSIPDLNKILAMSELFGVSTDYLLKDEISETPNEPVMEEKTMGSDARFVSMEEANRFLDAKEITAPRVALGTALCILSPLPLILLAALSESKTLPLSEYAASGLGLTLLVLMVAAAVMMFLSCRKYTADFDYLDDEQIETAYGITGMAKDLQENYRDRYNQGNMLGTCLCILSVLPLFLSLIMGEQFAENNLVSAVSISLLLIAVAIAVHRFISVGIIWESYQKLLQEGDYSKARKKDNESPFSRLYWPLVTALYFFISFSTGAWHLTWLIWIFASPLKDFIQSIIKK